MRYVRHFGLWWNWHFMCTDRRCAGRPGRAWNTATNTNIESEREGEWRYYSGVKRYKYMMWDSAQTATHLKCIKWHFFCMKNCGWVCGWRRRWHARERRGKRALLWLSEVANALLALMAHLWQPVGRGERGQKLTKAASGPKNSHISRTCVRYRIDQVNKRIACASVKKLQNVSGKKYQTENDI